MKTKFTPKVQTRFKVPVIKTRTNGTMHRYSKVYTLALGSSKVVRSTSKVTDEGYQSNYEERENRNGTLFREIGSNSKDCDGSYSSHSEQELQSGVWVSIQDNQRDHSAERMGF